ncbi:MAG: methionyl-tRNA formyltransferase [Thermomicrobium sp.]|nr:methionyl-tRNA formyltransferase [Thermomicrobium sp.]
MTRPTPEAIRLVFLGTPEFAVPSLERLAREPDFRIVLVVTQPDRPAGRGRELRPPAVKRAALALGLPVVQPASLRDLAIPERIVAVSPHVGVVVAYGELVPKRLLDLPSHGFLNVHPSLLPKYRGASPIQAAILNGDPITGVTIIRLTPSLDAGPIVRQVSVPIREDDTAGTLSERLALVAAEMLPETIRDWIAGRIVPIPQDERAATYTRPLGKEDGRIDWSNSSEAIARAVRAFQPWPSAWTTLAGKVVKILKVHSIELDVSLPPGCMVPLRSILAVATGTGGLALDVVQPEGKRPMSGIDWWRGLRVDPGVCFDERANDRPSAPGSLPVDAA